MMAGEPEFRFRHVLVRDVCYQRLPRTERVARHERTADWLDALAQPGHRPGRGTRPPPLHGVRDRQHARPRHRPYAPPARDALHRAARRAYALHALDVAASHAGRAHALADGRRPARTGCGWSCSAPRSRFYPDGDAFLAGGGTDRLGELATRLYRPATTGARRGPGPCWARPPGCAPTAGALRAWTGRSSSSTRCRTAPKAAPTPNWVACTCSTMRLIRRSRRPVRRPRSPSASAWSRPRPTRGSPARPRYQAGDRVGLVELQRSPSSAGRDQLLTQPRAVQNLAYALREEGDWIRSGELIAGCPALSAGEQTLATRFPGRRCAPTAPASSAATGRGRRVRGHPGRTVGHGFAECGPVCGCCVANRLATDLRPAHPAGPGRGVAVRSRRWRGPVQQALDLAGAGTGRHVATALDTARRSGFHRLRWTTRMAALCRALQGRG